MKKVKTIAIITAIAMLISMMPVMSFAVSAPAKAKITSLKQVSNDQSTTVKWKKVYKAAGYQVARKVAGGSYKVIKTVKKGSTVSYHSGQLTAGKTYYYKVRAYKKSGKKKIYGKYSTYKKIKIVRDEPKYKLNSIVNKVESGKVITEYSITIDSKCATVYLANKKDSINRVVRYYGVNKNVYNTAMDKLQEVILSENSDFEKLSDNVLKALKGDYEFATVNPTAIKVNGTTVSKGSLKTLSAGKTYKIQYVRSASAMVPDVKLVIGLDEKGNPQADMHYGKIAAEGMYASGFDKTWKTEGAYMMALKYRGDYYDATMAMDFEKGYFTTDIM